MAAQEPMTPMMRQYLETKKEYPDCILFYRLGDFYEMFFEDALTCSKELEITLTGKNCGMEERAPMCGVPFHSVDGYLDRLVEKGYKVAICEQIEDPKQSKGLVKREVIRVVTPGTNFNAQSLDESRNHYLMGILPSEGSYGVSLADVTTGDYYMTEIDSSKKLLDEIYKFEPSEIICDDSFLASGLLTEDLREKLHISVSALESRFYEEEACICILKEHFHVSSLDGLGLKDYHIGITAAGMVLLYLYETQKNDLEHLLTITPYLTTRYMVLDSSTRRNLELTETLREKQKRGSLLWVLDKTKTAMGARLLRSFVEQPLIEAEEINERLDAIEELNKAMITREEIREYLNPIYDLERLISRVSYRSANPRDLMAFYTSLSMLPSIKLLLGSFEGALLRGLEERLDPLADLYDLIGRAIAEDPPISVREGGIIKEGYHEEVDRLRKAKTEGKTWVAELEAREREKTGIKNLRIKYNKVFGYYLEVTNSFQSLVPQTWTRRQTLANAERYITPELKELEDLILGAEDRLFTLEYELFSDIREQIAAQMGRISQTAKAVAGIDVFTSLALVSERNDYHRPSINTEGILDIRNGRHPVVEQMAAGSMREAFVANDTYLDQEEKRISIITGPNMAGKSTYMRQTALIVLMAQIGCFIPAKEANIGIVDRIFTRVGASDDLASGQSTFMVEMTEVANILRHATRKSLLILDEIGRGTSTFDGLSIAWAVVEYISTILGAKALFATHYHELTELEGKLESVHNYCIAVKEQGEDIIFLRKIIPGGADKSYGIQVARLAGIPDSVLTRAKEISAELGKHDIVIHPEASKSSHKSVRFHEKADKKGIEGQISLFGSSEQEDVILELRELELERMSPIEAFHKLYELQQKIRERV